MKRNCILGLGLLLVIGMMALPGGASAELGGEITFWCMPNAPQDVYGPWLEDLATKFEAETGVKVNIEMVTWGDAWTRISTALATGEGADVFQVGTTWNAQFAATGGLAELDIRDIGGADAFMPANLESTIYKGKCYGVPWFAETRVLFYNKDMFAKAGVEPPQTYDEVIEVGKKIVEKLGEGSAIAMAGTNAWDLIHNWAIVLWANGGSLLNDDNTKAVFNDAAGVDGMKWYVKLLQEGLASKACAEYNQPQADAAFINGNVAMCFMGPWNISGIEHDNPALNYGIVEPPAGPKGRAAFSGGSNFAILKESSKQGEAKAWIKFLLQHDVMIDYTKNLTHMLPSTVDGFDDPYYESGMWKTFKTTLGYATAYPPLGVWGDIERAVQDGFTNVLRDYVDGKYDENTAQKYLDGAAKSIDAALENE